METNEGGDGGDVGSNDIAIYHVAVPFVHASLYACISKKEENIENDNQQHAADVSLERDTFPWYVIYLSLVRVIPCAGAWLW